MKSKEDELVENYKVESMMVKTLQEYLKSLESDYMNLMNNGDAKIKSLKGKNIKSPSNCIIFRKRLKSIS